jgi:phospholipid N-methyltransferase
MNIYVNPEHAGYTGIFDPPFHENFNLEESLTILELGSGAGIVGYHLLQVFTKPKDMIILTDLAEVGSTFLLLYRRKPQPIIGLPIA